MAIAVDVAADSDSAEVAEVAAVCFPLACPPTVRAEDIAEFVAENLSTERFGQYLADPRKRVLIARVDGRIIGYAMLIRADSDGGPMELSKLYVLAEHHRSGAAAALMCRGIDWARQCRAAAIWLGVNRRNERAQRFYRKYGFEVTGTRTFPLGSGVESDFVMERPV